MSWAGRQRVVYLALDGFRAARGHQAVARPLADRPGAGPAPPPPDAQRGRAGSAPAPSHIVRLLDADEEADPPYLVLEYVQGRPLSDFAAPTPPVPVAQVLDIAFKCGHALEYAQRQGWHRDIKPANILRTDDGEVKLVDFGAALAVRSEATQLAGLVGSPSYMSPEQVREEPLTHHSDMFSLAVVVYELLTGRRPFDGETDYATLLPHQQRRAHAAQSAARIAADCAGPVAAARPGPNRRTCAMPPGTTGATPPDRTEPEPPCQRSQDTETERFTRLRAPVFADFHDVALWELMRLGSWRRLPHGTILMRENTPGDSFCVIIEGHVTVSRQGWNLTLGPGVTLGEMTHLRPDNSCAPPQPWQSPRCWCSRCATRKAARGLRGPAVAFDKAFIAVGGAPDCHQRTTGRVGPGDGAVQRQGLTGTPVSTNGMKDSW